jgi:hypothetical protein
MLPSGKALETKLPCGTCQNSGEPLMVAEASSPGRVSRRDVILKTMAAGSVALMARFLPPELLARGNPTSLVAAGGLSCCDVGCEFCNFAGWNAYCGGNCCGSTWSCWTTYWNECIDGWWSCESCCCYACGPCDFRYLWDCVCCGVQ